MANNAYKYFHPKSFRVKKGRYLITNIFKAYEKAEFYKLRSEVFCRELNWVPEKHMETDAYDKNAHYIGVLDIYGGKLLGGLRLLDHESTWMLENEFNMLLNNGTKLMKTGNICEVTRLAVRKTARNTRVDGEKIADAIYQGLFIHCFLSKIRHVYMVVSVQVLRALRMSGLPCEAITSPKIMEDGVAAVVALLDWDKFSSINAVKNPRRWNEYRRLLDSVEMEEPEVTETHDVV